MIALNDAQLMERFPRGACLVETKNGPMEIRVRSLGYDHLNPADEKWGITEDEYELVFPRRRWWRGNR